MILRALRPLRGPCGFSLVELITVMSIMAIVAGMVAIFVKRPVEGYVDLSRRATLVDSAESALRRMARDIRNALPNSVRVTNDPLGVPGFALELIPTVAGGRYCQSADAADCTAASCRTLTFGGDADGFNTLGSFQDSAFIAAATAGTTAYRLVIGNLGNEVYGGPETVITPSGTTITLNAACTVADQQHIDLSPNFGFDSTRQSGQQRLFVIRSAEAAVTYFCNATARTLTRYAGYGITNPQPVDPAAAPLSAAPSIGRVAEHVSACSAATSTTNVLDRGLVTLTLTLAEQGEQITLTHQVQLDNSQ